MNRNALIEYLSGLQTEMLTVYESCRKQLFELQEQPDVNHSNFQKIIDLCNMSNSYFDMAAEMDSAFNLSRNSNFNADADFDDYNTEEDNSDTSLEELFTGFIDSLEMKLSKLEIQIGIIIKSINALKQLELKLNENDNMDVEKENM
jgi:hypothetical protein